LANLIGRVEPIGARVSDVDDGDVGHHRYPEARVLLLLAVDDVDEVVRGGLHGRERRAHHGSRVVEH
jgi:hypothetical protein